MKHITICVSLPFLKERKVPQLRKFAGESRYGFSEDDDIIEQALGDLISALNNKDHKKMVSSLAALIQFIKLREEQNADASTET